MILKKEIIEQLSKELSLPFTGTEQDWDIEMANSNRVDEFIKFYKERYLCDDKKVATMSLILASYDDLLNESNLEIDARWGEIKLILESEKVIFTNLMNYWIQINEIEVDNLFRITSLLKKIK